MTDSGAVLAGALIALVGTVFSAVVARIEVGGRRELREMAALINAASQLDNDDPLRRDLLIDAERARDAYSMKVDQRTRTYVYSALAVSVAGFVLLLAAARWQPSSPDALMPRATAIAAIVGFYTVFIGVLISVLILLGQTLRLGGAASQQPLWVRCALAILISAVGVGILWGALR